MGTDALKSGFFYAKSVEYVAALVSVDCWKWIEAKGNFRSDQYIFSGIEKKVGPLELIKWQDD